MNIIELLNFVAGCAVGGLLSWFITHRYYIKAGVEQKNELARLSENLRTRHTLHDFEERLTISVYLPRRNVRNKR
jgi:hypothetical protein